MNPNVRDPRSRQQWMRERWQEVLKTEKEITPEREQAFIEECAEQYALFEVVEQAQESIERYGRIMPYVPFSEREKKPPGRRAVPDVLANVSRQEMLDDARARLKEEIDDALG